MTIRDLGNCPCPRCLVQKHAIRNLGLVADMKIRRTKRRVDDERRQGRVESARTWIYKKGKGVASKFIDAFLKEASYVPTRVGTFLRVASAVQFTNM